MSTQSELNRFFWKMVNTLNEKISMWFERIHVSVLIFSTILFTFFFKCFNALNSSMGKGGGSSFQNVASSWAFLRINSSMVLDVGLVLSAHYVRCVFNGNYVRLKAMTCLPAFETNVEKWNQPANSAVKMKSMRHLHTEHFLE